MALTEKQLVELKESVTQAKTRVSELRGQLTALMKQLKEDWECELNDIPHIYTLENPSFEYFKTQIEYEINNKINKGPGRL